MSEMKRLMEGWRAYTKNNLLSEGQVEDYIRSQNLETYGDLVNFMKLARSKKRSVAGLKAIADWASDVLGKELVLFLINTYVRRKPPKPQEFLKLFRVDPKYAAIIDNNVEQSFLDWFIEEVDNDTSNLAQTRIDDENFSIDGVLQRWLASTFDGRTVQKS